MNPSRAVGHEITGVAFSFVTSEEARKISVKAINNPTTFDPITNIPNPNGLYDIALGPTDKGQLCGTCRMNFHSCPGHFGHIELTVPIYHPLLFKTLFSLLKSMCFCCHSFKMKRERVYRYYARLRLLYAGLVFESIELESIDFLGGQQNDMGIDIIKRIDNYVQKVFLKHKLDHRKHQEATKVTLCNDSLKSLTKEILSKAANVRKCDNCGGKSPGLRKESNSRIFEQPLKARDRDIMNAQGISTDDVFMADEDEAEEGSEAGTSRNGAKYSGVRNKDTYLTVTQVKEHMKRFWVNESGILDLLFGHSAKNRLGKSLPRRSTFEQFFLDAIPVSPSKFRPMSRMGDRVFDNPHNGYLVEIIKNNNLIVDYRAQDRANQEKLKIDKSEQETVDSMLKQIIAAWVAMQESANNFMDSTKNPKSKQMAPGIKQLMEKKEGLLRQNMMGKRVNYAARSVISPDPNIETSEIGIPMVFATKLTYPEPVTQHNFEEMRQAVINGPDTHPGAVSIQMEDGSEIMLQHFSQEQRVTLANQLLTPSSNLASSGSEESMNINKKVYRHLRNGDMLLLNRQPTLHKPSIMAHVARVLPGEKTIRMHYANCNTYNADFDGDEMNVHFPQNPIAQAEARLIANTNNQYLVPTSGEPLRGLIQDHVVSGVLISSKESFFTREDYVQYVYAALPKASHRIVLLPPAVLKPKRMWTGKQIISTILKNLTIGKEPLNLESKTQVPGKSWSVMQAVNTEEGDVIILDGELMTGILDKKQFGAKAYGLVHACFEVYGPDTAGRLLTTLGRLFTRYTQVAAFTCRMDDLIVASEADKVRRQKIKDALSRGTEILKDFAFGGSDTVHRHTENETPLEKQLKNTLLNVKSSRSAKEHAERILSALEEKKLFKALENTIRSDEKLASLDNKMKGITGEVTTGIVKQMIPNGLVKPFPDNGMQLMTVSGAKGSNVNVTQISCMLGQQELEGRRVPVMVSGKTLPSFRAYDLGPRAGGYITGRFLTGIKPQEYYFHCMAGREGLVDTAVKTARSGYLQRCLIKHLEGLKVNYDYSVRDSADGSIYQFHYGEDSLDVTKQTYLKKFKFNAQNYAAFVSRYQPRSAASKIDCKKAIKHQQKALKKPEKYDPALSIYSPSSHLGSVSEAFQQSLKKYINDNDDRIIDHEDEDQKLLKTIHRLPSADSFEALMQLKYLYSLVEPGEAVGLLAAQSIGEPSTQMTLNTFHFAGHGAKNVTLGIPRLREIIMTASAKPKTPQMTVPFLPHVTKKQAETFCTRLSKLNLSLIIENASVTEKLLPKNKLGDRLRSYLVRLNFCSRESYRSEFGVEKFEIQRTVENVFIKKLTAAIKRELKGAKRQDEEELADIGKGADISNYQETSFRSASNTGGNADADSPDSSDDDDEADENDVDGDATALKSVTKHKQHASYDGPDDDEKKVLASLVIESDDEEEKPAPEVEDDADVEMSLRRSEVVGSNEHVSDYRFDVNGEWCEVELHFPANIKKLLMVGIVERVVPLCVVREISGISKCFISETSGRLSMVTDGVNIPGMFSYDDVLDIQGIQSNDIAAILRTYGIEAARQTITREVSSVFAVYGIDVDSRHLSLIADYMTFEGGYKPFNRIGIESNVSPFAKMSFETTFHFLTDATLRGDFDSLRNPSAKLVLGKVVEGGTGSHEIIMPLPSINMKL